MTYRILTAIAILVLFSCEGEIEFKRVESESRKKPPLYRDVFLVSNAPRNKIVRDSVLVSFAKNTMPILCSLDASFDSYSIYFFESTHCTRNFDARNKGEYTSLAMDDDGCPDDDYSVFLWYKRSENNPKSWYLFYPETPADTIYCE